MPEILTQTRDRVASIPDAWNRFWFTPSDPTALGAIRIVAGLIALYLHATLAFDLTRYFGPDGLLPSKAIAFLYESETRPSYLHLFQSPTALWIAHALGAAVLILFTAGLFTRVTSIAALVVVLSTIHRAPVLTGEVELVLAFVMFYLCIGPSGAAYSLDARRSNGPPRLYYTATIATRLIQLHLTLVYVVMGLMMVSAPNGSWWFGDAIWFLIARPDSRMADLSWLGAHPYFIYAWSNWVMLYTLAFAPLVWNRWARPIVLLLAIPHWLLLALVSGRPLFCMLMLALNIAFAPRTPR